MLINYRHDSCISVNCGFLEDIPRIFCNTQARQESFEKSFTQLSGESKEEGSRICIHPTDSKSGVSCEGG